MKKPDFTLAEGVTVVNKFHDIRKPAFTLAEVLVTLGIIGVVAAMTLPMLAKNYNFYIRQQQFKKAYATLDIAAQKTQIDMGEGVRCHYVNGSRDGHQDRQYIDCDYFFEELLKNLNTLKICKGKSLEKGCITKDMRGGEIVYAEVQGGNDPDSAKDYFNRNCGGMNSNSIQNVNTAYIFNSGFMIMRYGNLPLMFLDINANKGPNKWGHDIFIVMFDKRKKTDSTFHVEPGRTCHPLDFEGYYSTKFVEYLYGRNSEL